MACTNEKDRHDREGGRQLLALTLPVVVACGLGGYFGESLTGWVIAALATLASVIVLAFPAASIRLVSGRFAELLPEPPPAWGARAESEPAAIAEAPTPAPSDDAMDLAREVLKARSEGTPIEVALTERWLGKPQRRGLGVAMMLVGAAIAVAALALLPELPKLWTGGAGLSFVGLVLWYRTL